MWLQIELPMSTKRICLLSGPRNLSTATMYSFAQRTDTTVVDEPLYAYYLAQTGIEHPGREEILQNMESDLPTILDKVIFGSYDTPVLFMKHMIHHFINMDTSFLEKTENIFFIRNPYDVLASYTQVIENPTMEDIGIKRQYEIYELLRSKGKVAALIDTKELLANPGKTLAMLCEQMNILFEESMLSWPAGARPEDGIWAKYWYKSIHNSTGFKPYEEKPRKQLSDQAEKLLKACQPYYDYLYDKSIKN